MAELLGRFFSSIGRVVECCTLVDFYNYIKAVEYLICVGFFVTFPLFYKHVIKPPTKTDEPG
ncbi:MAG: hypothetical protein JSV26_10035 [bacterium]|nr:MAG: hypothetical protein JSV26_10035 [bacterium]